jgi:hypothetical protein
VGRRGLKIDFDGALDESFKKLWESFDEKHFMNR